MWANETHIDPRGTRNSGFASSSARMLQVRVLPVHIHPYVGRCLLAPDDVLDESVGPNLLAGLADGYGGCGWPGWGRMWGVNRRRKQLSGGWVRGRRDGTAAAVAPENFAITEQMWGF